MGGTGPRTYEFLQNAEDESTESGSSTGLLERQAASLLFRK